MVSEGLVHALQFLLVYITIKLKINKLVFFEYFNLEGSVFRHGYSYN